jgi:hypothetical protein
MSRLLFYVRCSSFPEQPMYHQKTPKVLKTSQNNVRVLPSQGWPAIHACPFFFNQSWGFTRSQDLHWK